MNIFVDKHPNFVVEKPPSNIVDINIQWCPYWRTLRQRLSRPRLELPGCCVSTGTKTGHHFITLSPPHNIENFPQLSHSPLYTHEQVIFICTSVKLICNVSVTATSTPWVVWASWWAPSVPSVELSLCPCPCPSSSATSRSRSKSHSRAVNEISQEFLKYLGDVPYKGAFSQMKALGLPLIL